MSTKTKSPNLNLAASNATSEIERPTETTPVKLNEVGRKHRLVRAAARFAGAVKRETADTLTRFPGSSPVIRGVDKTLRSSDQGRSTVARGHDWVRDLFATPVAEHADDAGNSHALNAIVIRGTDVYGVVTSGSAAKNSAKIRLVQLPFGDKSTIPSDSKENGRGPVTIDEVDLAELDASGSSSVVLQQSQFNVVISSYGATETMAVQARDEQGAVALDNDTFERISNFDDVMKWQQQLLDEPGMWCENL